MTLYTQISDNRRKTVFFLLLFGLLFLAVGYIVAWYFNSSVILVVAAIWVIIQGLISYNYSDKIALLTSGAVPLEEGLSSDQAKRVKRMVTNLCISAGLPEPKLYLIVDSALNAFATGKGKQNASLAVTAGLVSKLNDSELEGVLAHELAHIGNEDIRLMSMVMVMAGMIALVSDFFLRSMWFEDRESRNSGVMLVVALVLAILAPLAATLIQLAISRKREFLADSTGALITRYPDGLISALQKISGDTEPLEVANRGNAHMYFANPLHKQFLAGLFSTHPPIEERIKALEQGSR